MTLRIDLKPYECLRVGDARIQAGPARISFAISGSAPVLRERDMITREKAHFPSSRLRFLLQEAYLGRRKIDDIYDDVIEEARQVFFADTHAKEWLEKLIHHVDAGDLFRALKTSININTRENCTI